MDKSETYVKMCDCPQIQEQAPEFYKVELTGTPPFSEPVTLVHQEFFVPKTTKYVDIMMWLPRQDQLQVLSGLSWQEFDKECLKYDADTKEQAGIQVVIERLDKTTR